MHLLAPCRFSMFVESVQARYPRKECQTELVRMACDGGALYSSLSKKSFSSSFLTWALDAFTYEARHSNLLVRICRHAAVFTAVLRRLPLHKLVAVFRRLLRTTYCMHVAVAFKCTASLPDGTRKMLFATCVLTWISKCHRGITIIICYSKRLLCLDIHVAILSNHLARVYELPRPVSRLRGAYVVFFLYKRRSQRDPLGPSIDDSSHESNILSSGSPLLAFWIIAKMRCRHVNAASLSSVA